MLKRNAIEVLSCFKPAGREDLEDFYAKYLRHSPKTFKHTPFLAFTSVGVKVLVGERWVKRYVVETQAVPTIAGLLELPPDTVVMKQWPGRHRSDWFWFTVAELREEMEDWTPGPSVSDSETLG